MNTETAKCAQCRNEKQIEQMKSCMHGDREYHVCDTACMFDFYNPKKPPVAEITPEMEEMVKLGLNPNEYSMHKEIQRLQAEVERLKGKKEKLVTVADYITDVMAEDGVENFTASYFHRGGREFELICRYINGKSVAEVLSDWKQRAETAEQRMKELERERGHSQRMYNSLLGDLSAGYGELSISECEKHLAKRDTEQQIKALDMVEKRYEAASCTSEPMTFREAFDEVEGEIYEQLHTNGGE